MVRAFAHGAMGRHGAMDPASAPRDMSQRLWYVLPCLWDDAYKEPLLLIGKSSPCGCEFHLSLSEWSSTIICLTPYNRK